jgi:hypothetical protein
MCSTSLRVVAEPQMPAHVSPRRLAHLSTAAGPPVHGGWPTCPRRRAHLSTAAGPPVHGGGPTCPRWRSHLSTAGGPPVHTAAVPPVHGGGPTCPHGGRHTCPRRRSHLSTAAGTPVHGGGPRSGRPLPDAPPIGMRRLSRPPPCPFYLAVISCTIDSALLYFMVARHRNTICRV